MKLYSIKNLKRMKNKKERKSLKQTKRDNRLNKFKESVKSDYDKEKALLKLKMAIDNDYDKESQIKEIMKNSNMDEFTLYKAKKELGFSEYSLDEVEIGETTIEKLEKKFYKKDYVIKVLWLIICGLILLLVHMVSISSDMKEQVVKMQTVVSDKESDFEYQLYKLQYNEIDKLEYLLKSFDISYSLDKKYSATLLEFIFNNYEYHINLDSVNKRIDFNKGLID